MRSHALGEHRGRVRGSFGGSRGGCFVSPRVFRSRGNPCGVALAAMPKLVEACSRVFAGFFCARGLLWPPVTACVLPPESFAAPPLFLGTADHTKAVGVGAERRRTPGTVRRPAVVSRVVPASAATHPERAPRRTSRIAGG